MARQMKDSGMEWIGEIHPEYQVVRLKFLLRESLMYGANESGIPYDDRLPRYIRITDITMDGKLKEDGKLSLSDESADGYLLRDNDILFARSGATVGKAFIYRALYGKAAFAGYLIKASTNEKVSADYLFFYTQSAIYEEWKKQIFVQATIQNIGADRYCNLPVVLPALEHQNKIVDTISMKCTEIDAVIERTKATIEEYKKLKQAVITEAVTKGVRGSRKMKDSGIEWLGCIPDEWDCTKLKQVWISVDSGVSVNAADYPTENDTQYGVLKTSCVSKFVFLPHEHKQVDADEYDRVACSVKKDTIIVSRMNTPDLVGACGYVDADYPNLFLPDRLWQIGFHPEVIAKFVWYYLNNQMVRAYISSLSTGTSSSMQNISKPQFGGISLAVPAIEEQHEIVAYLDEKCAALDTLILKKTALLTELETYKKSLIYEYVTGKKEVI